MKARLKTFKEGLREDSRVLYGYCVKCTVVKISNNVEKYVIANEFATYWDIPSIAYGLIKY